MFESLFVSGCVVRVETVPIRRATTFGPLVSALDLLACVGVRKACVSTASDMDSRYVC